MTPAANIKERPIRFPRRPGIGWKKLCQSVYEHSSGTRIHCLGIVRFPDGSYVFANRWPECRDVARARKEQGGSMKRGLMVYALTLLKAEGGRP